jgi:hypothetical protein
MQNSESRGTKSAIKSLYYYGFGAHMIKNVIILFTIFLSLTFFIINHDMIRYVSYLNDKITFFFCYKTNQNNKRQKEKKQNENYSLRKKVLALRRISKKPFEGDA